MTDPMTALDNAWQRIKDAEKQAAALIEAARIDFGREIRRQRAQGLKQADIARHYKVERETIRRYQEAADIADGLKPAKD
ncbi:hypothetical protein [Actinomadura bangladeshensis]|uniref:Uncharacterized protein n=1 Tax=Actinomadura bangladeshensis TaxID=453573 RepID=A0A6L9QCX5_9ACTN|nr:hypothetical protein [Actinomadura bangladeshensis]NEA21573.1 hypothetical protein [Actinomadura bangladeshensis]NEA22533.1 hypothetical protein [Actinomadura bangladeshensis]